MNEVLGKVATEVFKVLSSFYEVETFNAGGNRVYDTPDARNFYAPADKLMVSIIEDADRSKLNVKLTDGHPVAEFEDRIGQRLRVITNKYGMKYNVRTFGHEITPKADAESINVPGESNMTDNIQEGMYGTTKTSYQKVGECKVIIRHSAKVNEDKFGSRSRNIHAIFVETKSGERFKVSENNLHGARAMARHMSNGGSPFDTVGMKVSTMMNEMTNIQTFMKEARAAVKSSGTLNEEVAVMQEQMRSKFLGLRETLKRMGGSFGYTKVAPGLTESEIMELKPAGDYNDLSEPWDDVYKWQQAVEMYVQRKMKQNELRKPGAQLSQEDALKLLNFSYDTMKLYRDLISKRYAQPVEAVAEDEPMGFQHDPQKPTEFANKIAELAWAMGDAMEQPENYGDQFVDLLKNKAVDKIWFKPPAPSSQNDISPEEWEQRNALHNEFKQLDPAEQKRMADAHKEDSAAAEKHNATVDVNTTVWSRIIYKLNQIGLPHGEALTPQEKAYVMSLAPKLGVNLKESFQEEAQHVKADIIGDGTVDVDTVTVEKNAANQVQDMANFGRDDLVDPDDLMAGEIHIKEHDILESWFAEASNVEFFDESELALDEEPIAEFSNSVDMESAYAMFTDLISQRKMGSQEAIEMAARHYADTNFAGDNTKYEEACDALHQMGVDNGVIKHDDGSTFIDDVLSPNDEIRKNKDEIESEEYYGDANFAEETVEEDAFGLDRLAQLAGLEAPVAEEIVVDDMPYEEAVELASNMAANESDGSIEETHDDDVNDSPSWEKEGDWSKQMKQQERDSHNSNKDDAIEEKRDEDENADDWEDDELDDKADARARNTDKRQRRQKKRTDRTKHMDDADESISEADAAANRVIQLSRYRPS